MAANYLPYEPQQMMLLPESLQDWLPEGHLAHFISDTVDGLDLGAFHARYDQDGPRNQPFHPAMMVKVLVYGYATGVFSSRKIARKLHEDVAFRVLAAGNFPAHRTIRDFRALPPEGALRSCSCRSCGWPARWVWSSSARSRWTAPRSRPTPAATRR